jgi:hypothetical protein
LPKSHVRLLPQGAQDGSGQILSPGHKRRAHGQPFQFRIRRQRNRFHRLCIGRIPGEIWMCTEGGDIAGGKLTPIREDGGQCRTHFASAELQKSMARAALESCLQALRYLRVERKGVVLVCKREVSMRR